MLRTSGKGNDCGITSDPVLAVVGRNGGGDEGGAGASGASLSARRAAAVVDGPEERWPAGVSDASLSALLLSGAGGVATS